MVRTVERSSGSWLVKMTVFSKTASFNDLVPLLPALELPDTLKTLFSYRNFVHALAGAVVSRLVVITSWQHVPISCSVMTVWSDISVLPNTKTQL